MALAKLAVRRGATIGELELGVYSEDLLQFELGDIIAVLDRIGQRRPQEYEAKFPDCPTLIDEVRKKQHNRETRIRPEQLSPEARQALADVEKYKRLGPGWSELVPIGNILEDLKSPLRVGDGK